MPARGTTPPCRSPRVAVLLHAVAVLGLTLPTTSWAQEAKPPIAGAFVFPIGDELDFKKPAAGERVGFHVSDPYLKVRRGRKNRRVHYGVDLSNGQSGDVVRAIAAGVVDVSDGNAMIKYRKAKTVRTPVIVNGKKTYKKSTRYVTAHRWRSGWGNRVVIRHTLPDGQVVYSLYAHLLRKSVLVRRGEHVAAGQPIARVGRTGRASAPHLHLEIRTTRIDERMEVSDPDDESLAEEAGDGVRETQLPHTVDPMAFLVDRVMRYDDLEPGSWQARYALAAAKDGMLFGSKRRFDPDDDISRSDFYAALVAAFRLGTGFTRYDFASSLDALVDNGILDSAARSRQEAQDRVGRSDALELVLRCLDRGAARGQSMSRIASDQVARDFNAEFAGKDAAIEAEKQAKALADAETQTQRKAAKSKKAKAQPVKPVPILDPGFESLAQSDKKLSRAEACLLIASALRLGSSNLSALERAASRASKTG